VKDFRNPQDVHEPVGPYSHQVEISGKERMLVLSGQVGMRSDGSVPDDPLEQMDVALENILRNLRTAGMDVRDLIKMTYYAVDQINAEKRRELILSKFKEHRPCSTWLYVPALASPVYKIEIDAWASRAE
jgi:enamine deaminase RidA (YjgF/YER057c/UK114 family)